MPKSIRKKSEYKKIASKSRRKKTDSSSDGDDDDDSDAPRGFSSKRQWRFCFADANTRKKSGLKPRMNCRERARIGPSYHDLPETAPLRKKKTAKKNVSAKKPTRKPMRRRTTVRKKTIGRK